jgi:hypothetical protein
MEALGMILILIGVLLAVATYTESTGQLVGILLG